jgi:sec-independent protein translocase protein TatA
MGATEIIFIFAVYLLLFGAKGIPSLAQTMGQAVRTFRNATEDIQREILANDDTPRRDFSNVRDVTETPSKDDHGNVGDGPLTEEHPSPDAPQDASTQ